MICLSSSPFRFFDSCISHSLEDFAEGAYKYEDRNCHIISYLQNFVSLCIESEYLFHCSRGSPSRLPADERSSVLRIEGRAVVRLLPSQTISVFVQLKHLLSAIFVFFSFFPSSQCIVSYHPFPLSSFYYHHTSGSPPQLSFHLPHQYC